LVVDNQLLNYEEVRAKKTQLKSRPYFLNLDLMGLCNMKPYCAMCTIDVETSMNHKGMPVDEILDFGDFLDCAGELINCGIGEPTMHREFLRLVQEVAARGKMLGINSNGISLCPQLTDQLLPYVDSLKVIFSLDGATEETFRKIRGRQQFSQIISNIDYYCRKRKELGIKLASAVGLVFIIMRCNRHEIEEFFKLGARLGVDIIAFRSLNQFADNRVRNQNGFHFDYHKQLLSFPELEAVRLEGEKYAKQYGLTLKCQYQISEDESYDYFLPDEYKALGVPCSLPFRFILPYYDGRTVPCCYIGESYGDWRKEGLEAIWNSPRWQDLRAALLDGILPPVCLNAKSCPVTKAWSFQRQDRDRESLLELARDADGEGWRFDVANPFFHSCIVVGVHAPEYSEQEELHYCWLSSEAELKIPVPLVGEPMEVELKVKTIRPDILEKPISLEISLNDQPVQRVTIRNHVSQTILFSAPPDLGETLKLRICSNDFWVPGEHFAGSSDARHLTVLLHEIVVRKQKSVFVIWPPHR